MDWAQTTARRDENHLSFDIWCVSYKRHYSVSVGGNGVIQCRASLQKLKRTASSSWQALYCHGLSLVTLMLASLRYNFLQEALDFVGVHQDRMYQVRSG